MRRNTLTAIILALIIFAACQKEPSSCFTISEERVGINESVAFIDCSTDTHSFLWDFGDNSTSNTSNPTHSYSTLGSYTVELTTFSKNGKKSNSTKKTITVAKLTCDEMYVKGDTCQEIKERTGIFEGTQTHYVVSLNRDTLETNVYSNEYVLSFERNTQNYVIENTMKVIPIIKTEKDEFADFNFRDEDQNFDHSIWEVQLIKDRLLVNWGEGGPVKSNLFYFKGQRKRK